jgi:hypothetical protein
VQVEETGVVVPAIAFLLVQQGTEAVFQVVVAIGEALAMGLAAVAALATTIIVVVVEAAMAMAMALVRRV